ncbi:MAG: penicillin-binding transpeptidase domain-containing protein [Eubacteriales bacterium]
MELFPWRAQLMFSCNDALMQMGAMLGYDNFLKYQQIFNFGLKTNIDLPGEANNASSVFTKDTMGPVELATSSFGQGFNATMIQVASAFSSAINGGYYYQPHVVKKFWTRRWYGGDCESPSGASDRISNEWPSLIRQYLYHTMYGSPDANGNNPTGKKARVAGYAMGGKTGTAEKIPFCQKVSGILHRFRSGGQSPGGLLCGGGRAQRGQPHDPGKQRLCPESNIMKEAMPYLNIYATEEFRRICRMRWRLRRRPRNRPMQSRQQEEAKEDTTPSRREP